MQGSGNGTLNVHPSGLNIRFRENQTYSFALYST